MANFRFPFEAGQDDTGRNATYLQRSIPMDPNPVNPIIKINPNGYVSTYLFEGEASVANFIIAISDRNNSKAGDYLELIFNPTGEINVELGNGFNSAESITTISAGAKQILNFQYDGDSWITVGAAAETSGAVTSVNGNLPDGSGNVSIPIPPSLNYTSVAFLAFQSGTANPSSVSLENTSGKTYSITRQSTGIYYVQFSSNYATSKTSQIISSVATLANPNDTAVIYPIGPAVIGIATFRLGVLTDGILNYTAVEIKTYY